MYLFQPEDLVGEALYKTPSPPSFGKTAPVSVSHEGIERLPSHPHAFWVPHSLILHDGARCGTGSREDYMLVVRARDVFLPSVASARGLGAVCDAVRTRLRGDAYRGYRFLNALEHVLVGLELTADRACGDRIVHAQGSVFLFVCPSAADIALGDACLTRGALNMVSLVEEDKLCVHAGKRMAGRRAGADGGRRDGRLLPPPLAPFDLAPPLFLD